MHTDEDDIIDNAFNRILVQHGHQMVNYAIGHGESRTDADDILQEIMCAVWVGCPGLHSDSTPRQVNRWLQRVMRSVYVRHIRRRHHMPTIRLSVQHEPAVPPTDSVAETLDDMSADLTDDERSLIRQYLDGFLPEEIAAEQNTTAGAIRQRIHRIREKMKQTYTKNYGKQ